MTRQFYQKLIDLLSFENIVLFAIIGAFLALAMTIVIFK
jgi:hypothetical protein